MTSSHSVILCNHKLSISLSDIGDAKMKNQFEVCVVSFLDGQFSVGSAGIFTCRNQAESFAEEIREFNPGVRVSVLEIKK